MTPKRKKTGVKKLDKTTKLLLFGLILGFLSLVYLPTFLYPYLLTDEAWIVLPNTHTWVVSMGRPLFSVFGWLSAKISAEYGLGVIHVMRGSAVIGLGLSAFFLMRWLERWGHPRWASLGFALAAMTLPAYQIVVADGTQLAFAILFAILATHVFYRGFERRSAKLLIGSALLLTCALLIYQQQALIAFALLAVPLLQHPGERRAQILAFCGGVFITAVSCLYYVAWRIVYQIVWPNKIDTRYGPEAVGFPTLDQMSGFIDTRLPQVANLWHVIGVPTFSWTVAIVAMLIAVKVGCDFYTKRRSVLLTYVILAGLTIGSDSFALIAHAYSSYITATALSLLVFYWAFNGAVKLLGSRTTPAACGLAIVGGILAFVTVKNEIAIPNWRHFQEIRSAMLTHPDTENFHLIGQKSGRGYQEFGWRNAATDYYLNLVATNIADDLLLKEGAPSSRRPKKLFSIADVEVRIFPDTLPSEPRPDSVTVSLY